MNDLRLTLIQTSLLWENIPGNLEMFERHLEQIPPFSTDLILLPEMFNTGFSMNPKKLAEGMDGTAVTWMRKKSIEKNAVLCGSLMIMENGEYYNRLIWMKPDGTCETYDKRHLFRYAGEDQHFSPGINRKVMELNGWKICPLICYDLRFPVWSRNRTHLLGDQVTWDYDLLLFVANWPGRRSHAWKTLLLARAMENQCYVAGLNRIGNDGANIEHQGDSAVISPGGELISTNKSANEFIETVHLSGKELESWRKSFPAWMDADDFELK